MTESRNTGLLLLLLGILAFSGTTADLLPVQCFWVGVIASPIGAIAFIRGNRRALERAEQATTHSPHPELRGHGADAYAEPAQPEIVPAVSAAASKSLTSLLLRSELVLADDGEDAKEDTSLEVSSDISFPLDIQHAQGLAGELERLKRLHAEGMRSEEEFAAAKAKLLS